MSAGPASVTFLGHSGFLAELPEASVLFDWSEGPLPPLNPARPLYVFASHAHEDHFRPEIFRLDDGSREIRFLLGHDIKLSPRNLRRWDLSPETADRCLSLRGGQTLTLPELTVEALSSTDEGEAFLVSAGGRTLFHAGDLNWWHWEGEDRAWNRNMEASFLRYTEPLRGRSIDLGLLPLDPRLGEDGFRGPAHFLEIADIAHVIPMHQWGDFSFTDRFLARYPQYADRLWPVRAPGQVFQLP